MANIIAGIVDPGFSKGDQITLIVIILTSIVALGTWATVKLVKKDKDED